MSCRLSQRCTLGVVLILTLGLAIPAAHARRFGGGRSFGSHIEAPHRSLPHTEAAPHEAAGSGAGIRPRIHVDAGAVTTDDDTGQQPQPGARVAAPSRGSSMMWGWWLGLAVPATLLAARYRKYRNRGDREREFAQAMLAEHAARQLRTLPAVAAAAGPSAAPPMPAQVATGLADGSDAAALLRQMRASFLHLRTLNRALNGEQVRNYLAPELAGRLLPGLPNNAEQVKFPLLECELLDSASEAGGCKARLRFSGSMRVTASAPPVAFGEIWKLRRDEPNASWQVEDLVRDDPPA